MFTARHGQPARHQRHSTLERRFDFHLGEAVRAALQGSHDKAAGHTSRALQISHDLYATATDSTRHQPALAAALFAHSRYAGGPWQAIELLTESAGHYTALAAADPASYEVQRIDVLTRLALMTEAAGSKTDAIALLREAVELYRKAPAANTNERDLALARARFHLGRSLLETGQTAEALEETETGLELAAEVLDRMQLTNAPEGWITRAPSYLQLAMPDWAAAAIRTMTLHADAGRWEQAETYARTAIAVSAALAELGGDNLHDAHRRISAKTEEVLDRAPAAGF
jgi:tetratricopeptide (TPR) repeat protein